jgi:general L-amino acid transport system substrate-binding protein
VTAIEELKFAIEEWSADGDRLLEVLARACNQEVAAGAFWAATRARPGAVRLGRGLNALWSEGGIMYAPPLR